MEGLCMVGSGKTDKERKKEGKEGRKEEDYMVMSKERKFSGQPRQEEKFDKKKVTKREEKKGKEFTYL